MGSGSSSRRWQLVLEVAGERTLVYVVSTAADADRALEAVRGAIAGLMRKGGCRSLVVGVHVEGADCDHELGGVGIAGSAGS